jgi:MFS transporter, PAT family, beta-lactamase induction signal transducer AmpG
VGCLLDSETEAGRPHIAIVDDALTGPPAAVAPTAKVPPVWVLGMAYVPVGVGGAVTLISMPQLLSALRVPEADIATLTAWALLPGFVCFIFGPLLDWRFRRKSYAIAFTLLGGAGLTVALLSTGSLAMLSFWEFFAQLAISIGANAVGGWFSTIVHRDDAGKLGAWFTAWNIGAGGLTCVFAVDLIRATSMPFGAAVLGILGASAVVLFAVLPCKPADGRLAHESVKAFATDVASILKSRSVLWSMLLFLSPAASFALTNVLGGLGRDFSTPEQTVGLVAGVGGMLAGVFGSLAMPRIEKRIHPRFLYLAIGIVGAAGTLVILLLPRQPFTFALAVLNENVCQAAGFAVVYAIILRTIGKNNPLAATQFSLLSSAMCLPLTYMQVLDGRGYAIGGVGGAFIMDAAISGTASLVLMALFRRFRRIIPPD